MAIVITLSSLSIKKYYESVPEFVDDRFITINAKIEFGGSVERDVQNPVLAFAIEAPNGNVKTWYKAFTPPFNQNTIEVNDVNFPVSQDWGMDLIITIFVFQPQTENIDNEVKTNYKDPDYTIARTFLR